MKWSVPWMWDDADVFILGGGASLPRQFGVPENVITEVTKGIKTPEAYSEYLSPIHNKHVIGVNMSFHIGDWIDMVFFGDNSFFLKNQRNLFKFRGLKVSCHPDTKDVEWVKFLQKNGKKPYGISENIKNISWNGNSGAAAINVAANAGAKRIILLGFDMNVDNLSNQHWHGLYKKRKKGIQETFQRHLKGFPHIKKDAKNRGIEILNANPDSAIDSFKKIAIKDVL